ncbi:flagellin [Bradyrhizobium sp. dw_411]|uniref:flagellin n=1 Tax=Bradyrhizobium sp. dw_411 TaxID=2720082 RepID=UPI001BCDBB0F|nr:flagellin [Bradyrhizobium sp. dw_411]
MSGIVLSASVRQNLLSLQSTASLLATTQNDLATGNKVNSAIDNPTDYFTAQGLNNRASDINNLLDGIGNGVQVLQAANTGITSLQSLVASAQSIANQVLQSPTGYSTKSNVTTGAISGATADNLLGTGPSATDATFASTTAGSSVVAGVTAAAGTESGSALTLSTTGSSALSTSTLGTASGDFDLSSLVGDTFTVGSQTITFSASATSTSTSGSTTTIGLGSGTTSTLGELLTALSANSSGAAGSASISGGAITLSTTTAGGDFTFGGTNATAVLQALGLANANNVVHTASSLPSTAAITTTTVLSGTATGDLSTPFANNDTLTVDGKTLTFSSTAATSTSANGGTISTTGTIQDILTAIDAITGSSGANAATIAAGKITLHTGTAADLSITSSNNAALGALGLGTGVTQARTPGTGGLSGETLTIGATNTSSTQTAITFGTGAGQVSTLNGLNAALASNDLQATIDASTGKINIVTTNDAASSTIKAITGTATVSGSAFANVASGGSAPVLDPNSQATRASLVTQYNNVLQQINTTAQDSSFNGVNLLSGDTLNLTFDETGASKLAITGVTFNDAGLGLSSLVSGTDFLDNNSANTALTALTKASTTLRTEASALGSNLSIVQVRQDFNKNLIDVLQTGSSNLTLADTNEEAANSQALSTRQSIAVSALALANQSQQSVLQLLR